MSRTKTNTVEYFPHVAKSGKTLFILEGKYGNDGYTFWFKLLEILTFTENHFYNAADETDWQYLVARSRITDVSATEILSLLANLGNIDADLWKNHKIIWCQALVDNFSEVYRKRKREIPQKPICDRKPCVCGENPCICDSNVNNSTEPTTTRRQSATESTQSRVEESKVKNPLTPFQKIIDAWNTLKPELLPKAELTEKRKPKIKAAWKERPSLEWWEALFVDISLSTWHSHRDKWQGCSFDWILKNRTEMREKLDAIKKSNGDAPGSRDDPKDPFAVPGLLELDPNCPLCHGDWRNSKEPCKCLRPVKDHNEKPEPRPKTTVPAATC